MSQVPSIQSTLNSSLITLLQGLLDQKVKPHVAAELLAQNGDLSTLQTTAKNTLVAAINELYATPSGPAIDDDTEALDSVYSSAKVKALITADIAAALEGEDLSDLAQAIQNLQLTDEGLVSSNTAQSFTAAQKTQARANIGAAASADVNFDPAAVLAAVTV